MTAPPDGIENADGFDYIVVGSGAGGGPLAARLAERGFRVLVIEAGPDQSAAPTQAREVSLVPGLHGVSTEHADLSWEFFVEHYDKPPARDPKRHDSADPLRDGIFYPRASGLGGCTIHNAMITIAGPAEDWEDLADFLGDDSWRSSAMREYFRRLEHNDYSPPATPPPTSWWRRGRDLLHWLFGRAPDHSSGRHGFGGWLHTSLTELSIGLRDWQLVGMLKAALWQSRRARLNRAWTFAGSFLRGGLWQSLDPNHARTQEEHPEGVVQVPLAVCGKRTTIHQNSESPFVMRGRRSSPREFLLETRARYPQRLQIWTDTLITNVVFEPGARPRAIGVSYLQGPRLYRAHPKPNEEAGTPGEVYVKAGGEVILCAGAFNTPQILMLSGIGERAQLERVASGAEDVCVLKGRDGRALAGSGQPARIDLPGVGRNLQDRYEVTLISRMKHDFSLLKDATFKAADAGVPPDRHLQEWRAEGTGLYTSNGSVLGIFKRSRPDLAQPDLFIFGLPLPFRGYEVGYSRVGNQHDKFTWAILKGHTRNGDGTVRLRSSNPLDPPLVNFHSFNETSRPGMADEDPDLVALVDGVKFVRGITKLGRSWLFGRNVVKEEIHPGLDLVPEGDDARTRDWIRRDAWGHHACGTCRMGPQDDAGAVLDSRFRVRGVDGLRVVDTSIFPRIPGYFIVTNIYMASEKAADVIEADARRSGADTPAYPLALRALEGAALDARRRRVNLDPKHEAPLPPPTSEDGRAWASDVTGLAVSGGGIRSATFGLGVLQAFAKQQWLRRIDFLSTVSGGGYIGSFLGRTFDRLRFEPPADRGPVPLPSPCDRVEQDLNAHDAPALHWLRQHGNYIAPSGPGDGRVNVAIFIRSFLSVHFVVGMLLFALLGSANALRYGVAGPIGTGAYLLAPDQVQLPLGALLQGFLGPFFSPWFVLFELILLLAVLPRMAAYWVVSQDRHGRFSPPGLGLLFVFVSAFLYLAIHQGFSLPMFAIATALLASFVHIELAWYRGRKREEAIGRGGVETQRMRTRSYLTQDLGVALALGGSALVFALVDTAGHAVQQSLVGKNPRYLAAIASFIAAASALTPAARFVAGLFTRQKKAGPPSTIDRLLREQATAIALAAVLSIGPLVFMSFVSHVAYDGGRALGTGLGATLLAWVVSLVLAQPGALVFVNRSSLSQTYAARLARAYLGASNPLRNRPEGRDVTEVMAEDDVSALQDYGPHLAGGPLHLLNVTVNQTVDFASQRGNRERKGENLAVSPLGISVGCWHASWRRTPDDHAPDVPRKAPIGVEPLGHVPGTGHPLIDQLGQPSHSVEMLSLRQWMAISGAAVGPGRGQTTQLGTALLFGLTNLRTGYWWNSGMTEAARDGLPPLHFVPRMLYLFESLFLTQSLLLFEWVARYPGTWEQYWYLTDGGFFENLGAYELIRRRVPRIIVCDAGADPTYDFDDLAGLVRKVRIDFNSEIVPFTAQDYEAAAVPAEACALLGPLVDLAPPKDADGNVVGPSKKHASLFWVHHRDSSRTGPAGKSVLLYVKASVTGEESIDVQEYQRRHREFPHESTADQCFEEAQWESYRRLGEHAASGLVAPGAWFWSIRL